MTMTKYPEPAPEEKAVINKMLSRAQAGDKAVLPQLREFLDSRPDFCDHVGDLSVHLLETLLTSAAKGSLLVRESLARKVKAMEAELAGAMPTTIEKLLARRAVLAWLMVHIAELHAAELVAQGVAEGGHIQRRADSANRRYMQALKTMSTVRRLMPSQGRITTLRNAGSNDTRAALADQTQ